MSIDEKINEALGISNEKPATKAVVKKEFTPPVPRMEDKEKEDVDNDYKYSRENYYNLIERGQDAIQGILDIANEKKGLDLEMTNSNRKIKSELKRIWYWLKK